VTDELTALVVAEKRGLDAISGLTMIMGGAAAYTMLRMFPIAGTWLFLVTLGTVAFCIRKRRALGKLLARRYEIAGVDRITSLGRPALRVRFLEGGSVTLPTWNHDRERVFTLLSHKELPPARVLK
jgi:hypothetical protein